MGTIRLVANPPVSRGWRPPRIVLMASYLAVSAGCTSTESDGEAEAVQAEAPAQYNEVLWASTLGEGGDGDVAVREILFAPGWDAPRHFHNSDLFIYVLDGAFEVTMEGEATVTYHAGEALEMRTEAAMLARNPSDQSPLKLVVFQVGQTQAPFVVPAPDSIP